MKPENRVLRTATMALMLAGLVGLSGCMVTNKVLDLRKGRETRTKEATNFWSLAAVRSAHVMPGGEVFACAEFRDSPADEPQAYTINLSQTSRIGKTYADFMPAAYSRSERPRAAEEPAEPAWYLYPLPEAQKGCGNTAGKSPFPATALKIETVQIHREDQSRLPAILMPPGGDPVNEDRVIEVSFSSESQDAAADPESKKWFVAGPSGAKDLLLVYLPPDRGTERSRKLGVAGAFEPGSEWVNPYSLLVVPAIAADTAIITTIVMLGGLRYR